MDTVDAPENDAVHNLTKSLIRRALSSGEGLVQLSYDCGIRHEFGYLFGK